MGSYLADTNLLLRLADPSSDQHAIATQALARLLSEGNEVYLTPQNFIEFWAVATRPVDANGFGWSTERTAKEVSDLRDRFPVLPDSPEVFTRWLILCNDFRSMVSAFMTPAWSRSFKRMPLSTLFLSTLQTLPRSRSFHRLIHASSLIRRNNDLPVSLAALSVIASCGVCDGRRTMFAKTRNVTFLTRDLVEINGGISSVEAISTGR